MYKARDFRLEEFTFKSGGRSRKFVRMTGYNSVAIVPISEEGDILLEKQYRHTIGRYIYEIPAGHIDKGERPVDAALREMKEETGYVPGKIRSMFRAYTGPGHNTEMMHFYLASDMKKEKATPEEDERISVSWVSPGAALRMVKDNRIRDNKTVAGILYYLGFMCGNDIRIDKGD